LMLMLSFGGIAATAQQAAAPQGAGQRQGGTRTAPPPISWPAPPLADGPIVLDTAIQHQIRLTVTKGFNQPWSMAFLPDGAILVTARRGRLRMVSAGFLYPNSVAESLDGRDEARPVLIDYPFHPR